jgi:MinD-like ATPase involved in chromosome partitioning or flagellar assembly
VRKLLPSTPILVCATNELSSLSCLEQIARLGADDVLDERGSAEDFIRKLILLSRKIQKTSAGTLVLIEGGKGGVGTTSLTAALGELLAEQGKRVVVVDGDYESQDLSRFLQAKPFINDPLRLLLDEQRPVTDEFVAQCVVPIWQDMEGFRCMPPPPETDDLYAASASQARIFAGVFEALDSEADCILVDVGAIRGMLRSVLYRIADTLLFVVNNDPASLFASIDRVERAQSALSAGAKLFVVENGAFSGGLSNELLREEFVRSAKVDRSQWIEGSLPFCRQGARWPASGGTLFSQGSKRLAARLTAVAEALGLIPASSKSHVSQWFKLPSWSPKVHTIASPERMALPSPIEEMPQEFVRSTTKRVAGEPLAPFGVGRKENAPAPTPAAAMPEAPPKLLSLPEVAPKLEGGEEDLERYVTRARIAS